VVNDFISPADPQNPYVYAQTNPGYSKLVARVEEIASTCAEGKRRLVKVVIRPNETCELQQPRSVPIPRPAAGFGFGDKAEGFQTGLIPLVAGVIEASEKGRQGAKRALERGKRSFIPLRSHRR